MYIDDPLWWVRGGRREQPLFIALRMLTLCALGVYISWPKAQGGGQ
jgi:hypothetical protein